MCGFLPCSMVAASLVGIELVMLALISTLDVSLWWCILMGVWCSWRYFLVLPCVGCVSMIRFIVVATWVGDDFSSDLCCWVRTLVELELYAFMLMPMEQWLVEMMVWPHDDDDDVGVIYKDVQRCFNLCRCFRRVEDLLAVLPTPVCWFLRPFFCGTWEKRNKAWK